MLDAKRMQESRADFCCHSIPVPWPDDTMDGENGS